MLVPALGFVLGFAVCYVWTLARRRELLARLVDEAAETVAQAWAWKNRSLEAAARRVTKTIRPICAPMGAAWRAWPMR
jgi:hypothetical protein